MEADQEEMGGREPAIGGSPRTGRGTPAAPASPAAPVAPAVPVSPVEHVANPGAESSARPGAGGGRRETLGILKLLASFVVLVLSLVLPVAVLYGFGNAFDLATDDTLVLTLASAVGAMVGVCVLGGASMFRLSRADLAHVWKIGRGILIITFVMMLMQATSFLTGEASLSPTWPSDVLYCLVLCLAIGFYEEAFVRGILFNGLLAPFGRWRVGLIVSAILSSVFFGCMHIDWATLDYGDALQVSQAALKILQTTIYGIVLCACVAKEDRLTAAALYHAFDDFLLMVIPCGLIGEKLETEYVSTGESGATSAVLYTILIVLYIPSLVKALRELAALTMPRRGGFVRAAVTRSSGDGPVPPGSGGVPAPPGPGGMSAAANPAGTSFSSGAYASPSASAGLEGHALESASAGEAADGSSSPAAESFSSAGDRPARPW